MSRTTRVLPWLLLVLSLALNGTFLAGYWSGKRASAVAASGDARALVFERLRFDEEQRRAYEATAADLRARAEALAPETARLASEFWQEFESDQPDPVRLVGTLEQLTTARLEHRKGVVGAALAFQQRLSPEQRQAFRALFRHHDLAGVQEPGRRRVR